jgi:hypothetical protein
MWSCSLLYNALSYVTFLDILQPLDLWHESCSPPPSIAPHSVLLCKPTSM